MLVIQNLIKDKLLLKTGSIFILPTKKTQKGCRTSVLHPHHFIVYFYNLFLFCWLCSGFRLCWGCRGRNINWSIGSHLNLWCNAQELYLKD